MEILDREKTVEEVRKAAKIGVLVLSGVRMNIGGKMKTFKRGDVIRPGEVDLGQGEEMSEFLITVSRTLGDNTSKFALFTTKKGLDTAVAKVRNEVNAAAKFKAKELIDRAVDKYLSQGRKPSVPSFRRLIDETLAGHDTKIKNQHLINLCQDFDLKK